MEDNKTKYSKKKKTKNLKDINKNHRHRLKFFFKIMPVNKKILSIFFSREYFS